MVRSQRFPNKFRSRGGPVDDSLFADDEADNADSSSPGIIRAVAKTRKRTRPSAAEMREKAGDSDVTRNVPQGDRLSDQELLRIGLES